MGKELLSSYEIEKRIQKYRPYISIDHSTYVNTKTKCRFIDAEYGEWMASPANVANNKRNHPKRGIALCRQKRTILSQDIEQRIQKDRPYIRIDHSTYVNTKTKCRFIDAEYGEWWVKPDNVIIGGNHPLRANYNRNLNKILSSYEIEKRIQKYRPYISIDHSTYVNTHTKCRFIDAEYGDFNAYPSKVLFKSNHPLRSFKNRANLSKHTSFEALEIIKNKNTFIDLDHSTYINTNTKCRFIDAEYGEWWALPANVFKGCCHPKRSRQGFSKGEKEISEFVKQIVNIEENKKFYYNDEKNWFELDIYIPELKIGIEYNGLYWHSESQKDKNYHFEKREFFEKQGIQILQFYENEWNEQREIVKSIILIKIGKINEKYQARHLVLKEVENKVAQQFLKNNHLMGEYKSAKYVGLFDKDILVSLLGYKKIKTGIDISRFCNKINTSVAGGYSKLLNYIEKLENPEFIQSFVDLRYGNGISLLKMGFKLEKITLGWNWTDFKKTFNRLSCRANMDERKLSEKQHAEELGWARIYDAGQAKFIRSNYG